MRAKLLVEKGVLDTASLERAQVDSVRTSAEYDAARQKVDILTLEIARLQPALSSPIQTAQDFLRAVAEGNNDKALALSEPGHIRADGLDQLRAHADLSKAQIVEVWVAEEDACAVTSFLPMGEGDLKYAIGIGLRRQGNRWLVRDVDALPDTEKMAAYIRGFRERFPDALPAVPQAPSGGNP